MTDYTLYYWPIPFRGHFIRYVLAFAEARWDEPGTDALTSLKSRAPQDQPYPFMAPPLLVDHEAGRSLSQMPAILMYLGRCHELLVDPDRDLRLICDASDILFEITRYHGTAMWDADSWAAFSTTRLPRWMQLHEMLVQTSGQSRCWATLCWRRSGTRWWTGYHRCARCWKARHRRPLPWSTGWRRYRGLRRCATAGRRARRAIARARSRFRSARC